MADAKDDILYVACLIEYISRHTMNRRGDVATAIGVQGIRDLFSDAEVDHCLSFEQVCDEIVTHYNLPNGNFAPEKNVENPPFFLKIGKNYARLVQDAQPDEAKYPEELYRILCSKISEWMCDYRSAFYYSPSDYLLYAYQSAEGTSHTPDRTLRS